MTAQLEATTTIRGIDVSKWQGAINWAAVKAAGEAFAMIKATQGTVEVDAQLAANRNGSRSAGLTRGFYHFPDAGNPITEAEYFVAHSGRQPGEGQMLDFEGNVLTVEDPVGWALSWLNEVHALTHNKPLIYMSESVVTSHDWSSVVKANYGLNVADYNPGTPGAGQWPFWAIWQTGSTGRVPGISGNVDLDVADMTLAQLQAYFANETPPPPTPPAPTSDRLLAGQMLHKGQMLVSADKSHRLVMQGDGNLVIYHGSRATWDTRTVGRGDHLAMQGDGNLVLYSAAGSVARDAVWSANIAGRGGTHVVMQSDGNLVVYTADNSPTHAVWNSHTEGK